MSKKNLKNDQVTRVIFLFFTQDLEHNVLNHVIFYLGSRPPIWPNVLVHCKKTHFVEVFTLWISIALGLPNVEGLWGLVNNAGIAGSHLGPPQWMTMADYAEVMDINIYAIIRMTDTFLPLMKKERGSRIVNTASIYGRIAATWVCPYSLTKFCVEAYSDIMR